MNNDTNTAMLMAADRIREMLPKDEAGKACGTPNPPDMVGEIVDEIVEAEGGSAAALFAVADALTRLVPIGARKIRSLWRAFRRDRTLEEAALAICELLAGDPEAAAVDIGRLVERAARKCGEGIVATAAIEILGGKLDISAGKLRRFRDAYLVSELGGADLARLVPYGCPPSFLTCLAPILKSGMMPWRKKDLIVKAAEAIVQRGLAGRQATALVRNMLAEGLKKTEVPAIIVPAWHLPSVSAPETHSNGAAAVQPAA